jgi:hypothetical protein
MQRNLDANQHVAVTTHHGASGWNVGKDIVVEGTALRVTAAEALHELAGAWSPSMARTGASRSVVRSSSN